MTKAKRSDYRLRIAKPAGYDTAAPAITYIVRKGDRVSYISANETPLALSNLILNDSAAMRFALEDAINGDAAAKALREVIANEWRNNVPLTPTVEVL